MKQQFKIIAKNEGYKVQITVQTEIKNRILTKNEAKERKEDFINDVHKLLRERGWNVRQIQVK
jgi:hypothetical protein